MKNNKHVTQIDIKVHVTARDIAEGCAEDGENCPVAKAVQRAVNKYFRRTIFGRLLLGGGCTTAVYDGNTLGVRIDALDVDSVDFYIADIYERSLVGEFIDKYDAAEREKTDIQNLEQSIREYGDGHSKRIALRELKVMKKSLKELTAAVRPFSFTLTMGE